MLLAKEWLGLDTIRRVNTENIPSILNDRKYLPLQEKLAENALTLLKDSGNNIPFRKLGNMQLATINIGVSGPTTFTSWLTPMVLMI